MEAFQAFLLKAEHYSLERGQEMNVLLVYNKIVVSMSKSKLYRKILTVWQHHTTKAMYSFTTAHADMLQVPRK